ncbi:MAG: respiratory nitrate reductase subunit gamma [Acidobacteria bacterium]|nr:respiratory nitrate reductase subunit gamma [Acidobacteriota bacterium]
MTIAIYVVLCLSAAVFILATAVRAVWYARAPLHLRWELYPVPHEAAERAAHGGSYFEQSAWWTRPAPANHWGTVKALATEVLFLRALREFNRPLWWRSFPFHAGLYLLAATVALVLVSAVAALSLPSLAAAWPGAVLRQLFRVTGVAGLILTPVGAAGLLHRRLTDPDLRHATTPGDLFNLAAFMIALTVLGAGYALRPSDAPGLLAMAVGLLTWDTGVRVPGLLAAGLLLSALLAAYIPFTHMSHFVGKYFTYHAVRWDDAVNRRGGAIEKTMAAYLTYRPTWSAPHVTADGVRTWADVVTTMPPDKAKR